MGVTNDKIYTVPDGTKHKIKPDGKMTKGETEFSDATYKYHITDDGKIFKVDDNGEITELGDIDNLNGKKSRKTSSQKSAHHSPVRKQSPSKRPPKETENESNWGCVVFIIAVLGVILYFYHIKSILENDLYRMGLKGNVETIKEVRDYYNDSNFATVDSTVCENKTDVDNNAVIKNTTDEDTCYSSKTVDYKEENYTEPYFTRETTFYYSNSTDEQYAHYYPNGRCELNSRFLYDDGWENGSAEGTYYIQNGFIYVTWDGMDEERYSLSNNGYYNGDDYYEMISN